MPTILVVYNAKDAKTADDYEAYLKKKKVAFTRSLPGVESYEIYRGDMVIAPLTAEVKDLPSQPPYQFVAKIEVSDMDKFAQFQTTPEAQAFLAEYGAYLDPGGPLNVFVLGHRIEPGA